MLCNLKFFFQHMITIVDSGRHNLLNYQINFWLNKEKPDTDDLVISHVDIWHQTSMNYCLTDHNYYVQHNH